MTPTDPFAWPEDARLTTLRTDLAAARELADAYRQQWHDVCDQLRDANTAHDALGATNAAYATGLDDCIAYAAARDGRTPIGMLRRLVASVAAITEEATS